MALQVGQRATRRLTVTAEHVQAYAEITGDGNPLHVDEGFAAGTKFGRLVVQGGSPRPSTSVTPSPPRSRC
jgi:3-hydroxybutyryl-CoA dehydratase